MAIQSDRVLKGLVRHPLCRRNWNSKGPASRPYWHSYFFDSQGLVYKEFVPEGKTVNAEFYKGVTDHLLKRIQRGFPAAFCSRIFFCCAIMLPPTKLQMFANFWPKNFITLYQTPYSTDLSPTDYFLFPKLKMKLKGLHCVDVAEIQKH